MYRSAVVAQGDAILVKDLPAEIRVLADLAGDAAEDGAAENAAAAAPAPSPGDAPGAVVPPLTIAAAFDFIYAQLAAGPKPILPRVEQELIRRALATESGEAANAARRLGLTKAALVKKSKDVDL